MSVGNPTESVSVAPQGQRGFVCLLFSDLCDYTALSESGDPEDSEALRGEFEILAKRVISRHRGEICQFYGDGLLAVFGLPEPAETDTQRAIAAALELHESARSIRWHGDGNALEMRLHSGIHAGLVLARDGDALHGLYDLTGDPVNTAARLCAAAARDQILVSESTLHGVEAFFGTEDVSVVQLKGKASPLSVRRVVARSSVRTRFEARTQLGLTRFVGRESELDRLEHATKSLLAGASNVLTLAGAAGVGKTRLLEEFRSRRNGSSVRVLYGCCEHHGETEPLQPFLQVARELFEITGETTLATAIEHVQSHLRELELDAQHDAAVFLHVLSLKLWSADQTQPSAAKLAIARAFAALFASISQQRPIVLVLDDWQWADEMSRVLLAEVMRLLDARPMLLVIAVRGTNLSEPMPRSVEHITLRPFTEVETRAVVQSLIPHDFDQPAVDSIHQHSGGNALFLEELCRSLPKGPLRIGNDVIQELGVPTSVRGLVHARVSQLPAAQAELLRVASVIGLEFSTALLEKIAPSAALAAPLAALVQSDLIHPTRAESSWRFKHGIVRDVIYESVRVGTRRETHRAIAALIANSASDGRSGDPSEALAYHHKGSGDHAAAARYATLAGDKALASSSLDRAQLQYAAALSEYDRLPTTTELRWSWFHVCGKWAFVSMFRPHWGQLATLERAAQLASELRDDRASARATHWLGWLYYALGDQSNASTRCRSAIALAERAGDTKLLAQLWLNLGQSRAAACDYTTALAAFDEGLGRKRDLGSGRGVPAGYAYALGCRALIHGDRGDFDNADRDMREALAAVRGSGHAVEGSLAALGCMIAIWRGDLEACRRAASHARAISEPFHSDYVLTMSLAFEGYVLCARGGADEGLEKLGRAVRALEDQRVGLFMSFVQACYAEALANVGHLESAREYAIRAVSRATQSDPIGEITAYRVLARLAAKSAHGASDAVQDCLSNALRRAEERQSSRDRALVHALAGELMPPAG